MENLRNEKNTYEVKNIFLPKMANQLINLTIQPTSTGLFSFEMAKCN